MAVLLYFTRATFHLRTVVLFCLCLLSTPAQSAPEDALFLEFQPKAYSKDELRFIQLSLAFEGYYHGLLDGAWGKISSRALEKYTRAEFASAPLRIHAAYLAMIGAERASRDDWQYRHFKSVGLSFLVPNASFVDGNHSEKFANFEDARSSLAYSITFGDAVWTQGVHDYTEGYHASYGAPYTVRKTGFAVTSSQDANGASLYVRSHLIDGMWATLMLSAERRDAGLLGAVSSSISTDPYVQLWVPLNGQLYLDTKEAASLVSSNSGSDDEDPSSASPEAEYPNASTTSGPRTGSGIRVSEEGHILSNAHVVEGCSLLKADGEPAELIKTSESFDLALLKSSPDQGVASFADQPARLNQDITVVGFPLSGLLGGINVTRGSVSALTGLTGDETTMQISAPVQVGNSGGPVISSNGDVVGVVVSKLSAQVLQDAIGDTPQNVNFAVRGEVAKLFLSLNGLQPLGSKPAIALAPEDLAQLATQYTVFIECN